MLAIYREKKVLEDILIIFCFSLICLVWFKDGYLINNVDLSWPVEYDRNLIERFSVWQEQRGGGGGLWNNHPWRTVCISNLHIFAIQFWFYRYAENRICFNKFYSWIIHLLFLKNSMG